MDATQAGGVSAEDAAAAILAGIEAGRREILVGKGAEMKALWFKRFMPERLFRRIEADTAKAFGAAAR
jgi:short-subunit dehydrogenase